MASIEKRGEGRWLVRWRDPDNRPRARSCKTRDAANRLRRDVEQAVEQGRRWEPRDARALPLLQTVAEAWIAALVRMGRAPKTVQTYASHLQMFLTWLPTTNPRRKTWEVDALARSALEAWYDELVTTTSHRGALRAPSAARQYVSTVELFWSWAANHNDDWNGLIPPPRRVTVEIQQAPGRQRVAPTWDELARATVAMTGWHRHLAVVLYYVGLRVQQAMQLRWDDLDLDRGELTIRSELGKTRSEKRGRTIPLSPHFLAELRLWPRPTAWMVPKTPHPDQRRARSEFGAQGWEAAGIRRVVWSADPWHCFRAGWQSNLLRVGGSWLGTEYYMGHQLPGTGAHYVDPVHALGLAKLVQLVPRLELPEGWASMTSTNARGKG